MSLANFDALFLVRFPPMFQTPRRPRGITASLGQHPPPPPLAPTADSLLLGVLSWFAGGQGACKQRACPHFGAGD